LEWFVAGYLDFLSSVSSLAVDPTWGIVVIGEFISPVGITTTNGLHGAMLFQGETLDQSRYDGFIASFGLDGSGRWLRTFGNVEQDFPGQVVISGQAVIAATGMAGGTVVFDASRADGSVPAAGSLLATWNVEDGEWQRARPVSTPWSSQTKALAILDTDSVLTGTWAGPDQIFWRGNGNTHVDGSPGARPPDPLVRARSLVGGPRVDRR